MANIRVPLLLTLGSLERADVSFAPLSEHGPSLSADWPNVAYQLIEGADHSYSSHVVALWKAARAWLDRVHAPSGVA